MKRTSHNNVSQNGAVGREMRRVLLIYTGGTIGMGRNLLTGALEPLDFRHLMDNLYEFRSLNVIVDTYSFPDPIDSSNMDPQHWARLARIVADRYEAYDGFVILHGTDTMAYTSSALSFMLRNRTKPVILTGSQLPIGQPRTDAKENLLTSIELAAACDQEGHARVPEVCIYFNGHLLRGNRATKQNAEGFNAFESFNYPHLCDAGVSFTFRTHHILTPDYHLPLSLQTQMNPNVVVFSLFPGIQECIVKHVLNTPELKGIVIRSFGAGNAPQSPWILKQLSDASQRGVTIVNISQCETGCVEMGLYAPGMQLLEAGVVSGYDSTVEAAVTKLMHLNALYDDPAMVRRFMGQSLCGEITTVE
ncbi:MAG: asparaginase [Bacteroidaceae bacterium]